MPETTLTPEQVEKLEAMLDERPVAWFDLDGTLADTRHRWWMVSEYRRQHGSTEGFDWTEYAKQCAKDAPVWGMLSVATWLRLAGLYIVICTSRPEGARAETEEWLKRHQVRYDELLMAVDDHAAEHQVEWKKNTINGWDDTHPQHYISVCFEDNWDIATMYDSEGFNYVVTDPGYGVVGLPPLSRPTDD